jgi:hypothetical protein
MGLAMTDDQAYFCRRASEERTAALNTQNKAVREAHTAMAERYEAAVRELAAKAQRTREPSLAA